MYPFLCRAALCLALGILWDVPSLHASEPSTSVASQPPSAKLDVTINFSFPGKTPWKEVKVLLDQLKRLNIKATNFRVVSPDY